MVPRGLCLFQYCTFWTYISKRSSVSQLYFVDIFYLQFSWIIQKLAPKFRIKIALTLYLLLVCLNGDVDPHLFCAVLDTDFFLNETMDPSLTKCELLFDDKTVSNGTGIRIRIRYPGDKMKRDPDSHHWFSDIFPAVSNISQCQISWSRAPLPFP